ncbi:outer membrane beta-barrel protein [Alcanivorax sp.]|uniref:outer membrane beta-barrel protein n=1 Tax=Alcanivorax sp. TaxID=1872427 RepID=UPI003A9107CE
MTIHERRVFGMRMGLAMLVAVGVIVSAPLRASDDPLRTGYAGVQYNLLDQQIAAGDDAQPRSVQAVWGWQYNTLLALEARLGYGVSDDEGGLETARVSVDPQWLVGGYLKMGLSYRLPLSPYVLLGHSSVKREVTVAGGDSEDAVASDPSYGMGASIKLNERNALTVEWLQLDDDDNDLTTVNVGYLFRY